MKNKILSCVGIVVGLLATPISVFAQVPEADPTVVQAMTDTVTGLQQAGTSNLGKVLPIAGILLISVAVVYFPLRHIRAIAHV